LLVASPGNRARPLRILEDLGFGATEVDDPYAAMTELCRRPLVYRAMIVSLASVYKEELSVIGAVKSRYPHVELWLAHTDGRQSLLAEAMRLGADGLLSDDGLHRVAAGPSPLASSAAAASVAGMAAPPPSGEAVEQAEEAMTAHDSTAGGSPQPILTPDELRALLHEQSPVPPDED
jgi:hypothetical protein